MRLPPAIVLAFLAVTLVGCRGSSDSSSDPTHIDGQAGPATSDQLIDPCPDKLAQASVPTHGLGTSRPARQKPQLPRPEVAWVCTYAAFDTAEASNGGGAVYAWVRQGSPTTVGAEDLAGYGNELERLDPVDAGRACEANLGPRYVLVYAHDDGLIGVAVDDFGCQDVRLTDDPVATVPGEAGRFGTVPGILKSSPELLAALKAAAGRE